MKVAFLNKTENFCPTKMKYFYAPPLWLTKFKIPWSNYIYYYGFSYYFCWFVTLQVISTNLQYRLVCFFPDQRVYVASHAIEFNVRQIFDINITIVVISQPLIIQLSRITTLCLCCFYSVEIYWIFYSYYY